MRKILTVGVALAAFSGFAILMTPGTAPAASVKDQRYQGASAVQCKSGVRVKNPKACKENGGRK